MKKNKKESLSENLDENPALNGSEDNNNKSWDAENKDKYNANPISANEHKDALKTIFAHG